MMSHFLKISHTYIHTNQKEQTDIIIYNLNTDCMCNQKVFSLLNFTATKKCFLSLTSQAKDY